MNPKTAHRYPKSFNIDIRVILNILFDEYEIRGTEQTLFIYI